MNSIQCIASSNIRYSLKKSFGQVPKKQMNIIKQASTSSETAQDSSVSTHKIIIPKRIKRGPTDILKALSNTVQRDYNAPHYKYHDDPFLIPTSNMTKRMYALAQESGRKAAHWIRQEHADLFQHRVADPPIEVYFPKAVCDENSEVDETTLQKVIEQQLVSDALTIHGLLEQKGVELTRVTKQSLLELICYYNGQDPMEEEWIEERWFRQGGIVRGKDKKMNTWKNGSVVQKLFESLSPHDSASYSAMLCGKAQFGDMEGAYRLYQEATEAGIFLPVQVYNKLITGAATLKESHELRWQFVEDLLNTMSKAGVSPDLSTLNAALETLATMSTNKECQKNALSLISEFRAMKIEPSLTSYYFLLNIFCQERTNMRSAVLVDILDILEGKSLSIQDPRDIMFFTEAMNVCRYHLSDVDLAYRLNRLLFTADNYNLIGDSYKESIYYRNFFGIILKMGTLKELMELYEKLVPNIYVPEPLITEDIIKTVDLDGAYELLPSLWSDIVMFEQSDREPILCAMLTALRNSCSTDKTIIDKHADVAWAIWISLENQRQDRKNKQISWTGTMLGDVLQVLLRADRYSDALQITNCLDKKQQEILGVPMIESLNVFLDKSIERKDVKNSIWCIQYCSDAGFEDAIKLGQKLKTSLQLNENEQNYLINILGPDFMKKESATTSG